MDKRTLSSRKWLALFLATVLAFAGATAGFNLYTDPYGAFGDPIMQWWSYDMTLNPRLAKVRYLEQNHQNYDSYIIGASGTSALSVETLNRYLDASFYDLFIYHSDAKAYLELTNYLLDRYPVKHLILNLTPFAAVNEQSKGKNTAKNQYWRVDGSNPLLFYGQYLFLNPQEGFQKLKYWKNDGYLPRSYKTIVPETGEYDRGLREIEPIHDLQTYLEKLKDRNDGDFAGFRKHRVQIKYLQVFLDSVQAIKDRCETEGVELIVVCQPAYCKDMERFHKNGDLEQFFNSLAEITDYWDFTLSSVSYEPRYFYDITHCRNAVGRFELARIFGDNSVYVPEDFGRYVPQGSVPGAPTAQAVPECEYTVRVPILRYCRVVERKSKSKDQVSLAVFTDQMNALEAAGYTPVDIWQMRDYVERGAELPDKPILLSFDDGYADNYTLAYPILQAHGFKATFFPIGVTMGKERYKDTGKAIPPHYSLEQAREMEASGLITLGNHGWDIHELKGLDQAPIRSGMRMRKNGETEAEYVEFLSGDIRHMRELLGESAGFFAVPQNHADDLSRMILAQNGIFATLCGKGPYTVLVRGLPQSLQLMNRIYVTEDQSGKALVSLLDSALAD